MSSKKYQFYGLVSSDNMGEIRYVGVTSRTINQRFSQHKYCATHPNQRGLPVHKWMWSVYQKGGKIIPKLIDECEENCWEEREIYWIDYYRKHSKNLLNIDKGGHGVITSKKKIY